MSKNIRLSVAQQLKLHTWFQENFTDQIAGRHIEYIGKLASSAMGFAIGDSAVKTAYRALELEYSAPVHVKKLELEERVTAIEKRLDALVPAPWQPDPIAETQAPVSEANSALFTNQSH